MKQEEVMPFLEEVFAHEWLVPFVQKYVEKSPRVRHEDYEPEDLLQIMWEAALDKNENGVYGWQKMHEAYVSKSSFTSCALALKDLTLLKMRRLSSESKFKWNDTEKSFQEPVDIEVFSYDEYSELQ